MRIAIVDDEASVRETLKGYIDRMSKEKGQEMSVFSFPSGNALLHDYAQQYDILIFDIDMPGLNGMDTARKIREMDEQVVILFITNIAQYAINGYEVDAVDYIIKPITAPSTGKAADKEEAKGSGYVPLPFLRDFYAKAYQRLRKYLPEEKTIVFHDGFRCTAWNKFFREAHFKNVALDTHIYIFAMENFVPIAKPWVYKIYLNACMAQVRKAQKDIPVIVGEWCICNKYANKMEQSVMTQQERAEKQKQKYREIAALELNAWQETAGWFYWNYQLLRDRTTPTDESWKESWDFCRCVKNGWLTKEALKA